MTRFEHSLCWSGEMGVWSLVVPPNDEKRHHGRNREQYAHTDLYRISHTTSVPPLARAGKRRRPLIGMSVHISRLSPGQKIPS